MRALCTAACFEVLYYLERRHFHLQGTHPLRHFGDSLSRTQTSLDSAAFHIGSSVVKLRNRMRQSVSEPPETVIARTLYASGQPCPKPSMSSLSRARRPRDFRGESARSKGGPSLRGPWRTSPGGAVARVAAAIVAREEPSQARRISGTGSWQAATATKASWDAASEAPAFRRTQRGGWGQMLDMSACVAL